MPQTDTHIHTNTDIHRETYSTHLFEARVKNHSHHDVRVSFFYSLFHSKTFDVKSNYVGF